MSEMNSLPPKSPRLVVKKVGEIHSLELLQASLRQISGHSRLLFCPHEPLPPARMRGCYCCPEIRSWGPGALAFAWSCSRDVPGGSVPTGSGRPATWVPAPGSAQVPRTRLPPARGARSPPDRGSPGTPGAAAVRPEWPSERGCAPAAGQSEQRPARRPRPSHRSEPTQQVRPGPAQQAGASVLPRPLSWPAE